MHASMTEQCTKLFSVRLDLAEARRPRKFEFESADAEYCDADEEETEEEDEADETCEEACSWCAAPGDGVMSGIWSERCGSELERKEVSSEAGEGESAAEAEDDDNKDEDDDGRGWLGSLAAAPSWSSVCRIGVFCLTANETSTRDTSSSNLLAS